MAKAQFPFTWSIKPWPRRNPLSIRSAAVWPATYYLAISVRYNNQPILWDMKMALKAGANSLTLDPHNAQPMK